MAGFNSNPLGNAAKGKAPARASRLARFWALLFVIACVAGAAQSVAYYTTAGQPRPLAAADARDANQGNAKGGVAHRSRKPPIRLADATDSWLQSLTSPSFWQKRRTETERPRRRVTQPENRSYRPPASPQIREARSEAIGHVSIRFGDSSTYRTMCVRLCDGYFWPISFTATKHELARDSEICERSCAAPVALHFYRNPGEEPPAMVDMKGQPYAKLPTAFRYRVRYDPACKCQPHPWEAASRHRHLSYAQPDQVHATATTHKP